MVEDVEGAHGDEVAEAVGVEGAPRFVDLSEREERIGVRGREGRK